MTLKEKMKSAVSEWAKDSCSARQHGSYLDCICDSPESFLESPQGQELLRWVAEEAVGHATYERNFLSKDYGIVFSEGWWESFKEGL
jgi:hypothetical protein